mgnify:CR=1 FL=1
MLTAMLAKKCKKAYGIEIVEQASRCADELKNENGLQVGNAVFFRFKISVPAQCAPLFAEYGVRFAIVYID